MPLIEDAPTTSGWRQLRHDLLNPVNVLLGAARALRQTSLDDQQRVWVRMVESTATHLQEIIDRLETYRSANGVDGQERLADLCTIAAARVSKPVDRRRLVETIERVIGDRGRVLLVDDSPELAMLIRTYLDSTNYDVDVVDSGESAVMQASSEPYDVVLMDIDLPGVDGATAAHAIRAADLARGASPTPIIAMTAFDRQPPGPSSDLETPHASSLAEPRNVADVAENDEERSADVDPEIAPLIPEFLQHRQAELAMFREALERTEFTRIQSAAHKLKGTGRGYGFPRMSRIGGELEVAAHRQDVSEMNRLIEELDGYLQRLTASAR